MAAKQERKPKKGKQATFHVRGKVDIEARETFPQEMELHAYAFTPSGAPLGSAPIDVGEGTFKIPLELPHPGAIDLIIGPAGDPKRIRDSRTYRRHFDADAWHEADDRFTLEPEITLPPEIWRPWLPIRVCISGRVRKVHIEDGETERCPVPYAKVEIFDVDREICLWPHLRDWWKLGPDHPIVRLPELLKEPLPLPVTFAAKPGG